MQEGDVRFPSLAVQSGTTGHEAVLQSPSLDPRFYESWAE